MGLLSFLQRRPQGAPGASDSPTEIVERARAQARRRLIGAIVLVGVGIVAFPILFETQPRPIPVDLPIVIPKKDAVPPLAPSAVRVDAPAAPKKSDEPGDASRAEAARDAASAPVRAAAPAASAARVPATPAAPASAPASARVASDKAHATEKGQAAERAGKPAAAREGAEGERARALLEARVAQQSAAADGTPATATRVVVQVGAYADVNAAREVRQRVERLGIKTYVQEVQTDGGKRVRVRIGPFASREEADKVAARVKASGLPAAVVAP